MRKPTKKSLQNKADGLLTPIIQKLYKACALCGGAVQVAHHHYHKSKSTRLRYELDNLVPLCGGCHVKLHNNESYWGTIVSEWMGKKRFEKIRKLCNELVKADIHWYQAQYDRLKREYEAL